MSDRSERDELVDVARRLEELADEGGAAFDDRLEAFNARARAECTRRTFQFLDQSQSVEELVERLLEIRDAPPLTPPRTREGLEEPLARAASRSFVDHDRAGQALAHRIRLPSHIAHELGTDYGTFPEVFAFALEYEPPATRDGLLAFVRRWIEDGDAGRRSFPDSVGEALLRERRDALDLPELDPILERLGSGIAVQREHGLRRLRRWPASVRRRRPIRCRRPPRRRPRPRGSSACSTRSSEWASSCGAMVTGRTRRSRCASTPASRPSSPVS